MGKLLKQIIVFSITIGFIALGMNLLFGEGTASYIQNITIETATGEMETYKAFNFYKYITTVTTNFTDLSSLELVLPTRTWEDIESNILAGEFWEDLGNNLALMLDYIIVGLNVLMYPFKITGYILQCVLGLLGIDTLNEQSNLYWLVKFAKTVKDITIPYV